MSQIPDSLVKALRARRVIPFAGAGVSLAVTDAGGKPLFPSWVELFGRAAKRLEAENFPHHAQAVRGLAPIGDYGFAAETAHKALGPRWFDFLQEQFDRELSQVREESLELARTLWRLGSPLVVTTNYDNVLKRACPDLASLRQWTPSTAAALAEVARDRIERPTIWHLHGHVDRAEEIILASADYQKLYEGGGYKAALETLRFLLTGKTFLFVGFGMEEAIRDQIRRVVETFKGAGGDHYVLAKDAAAMERAVEKLPVQVIPYADHGAPLLDLMKEMAAEVEQSPRVATERAEPDASGYLEYLHNDTALIEIRGLQVSVAEAPVFPIGELYIPLIDELGSAGESPELREKRRTLVESLEAHARLVILGDPGSGKTTFLRRMANAACEKRVADPSAEFPILIRVAELAEFLWTAPKEPVSIAAFAASQCQGKAMALEAAYFERRLSRGPCLLLVDGLDEAPDEPSREMVSRLLEQAARAWKKCRIAVTTRPRAYEGEVMLAGFNHARVGALEREAVRTFLRRWSGALFRDNPERAPKHAEELIAAVESSAEIRRIASNPVMLTALAVLHWNERRMPQQRAELYASVLKWLARSRQRANGRGPEARLTVFQELAYAMQTHPKGRQVQVSREWAAEHVLAPALRTDLAGARAFLREEELDSGIVVSRGADVRFWHLTFQEYLAARLLSTKMQDEERRRLLFGEGRAWRPEWREVVLLLAGELHQLHPTRVDALVSAVLDQATGTLANQARCAGLLGGILRDLAPLKYQPPDPRYQPVMDAVLGIFDAKKAAGIPIQARLEAADALGQAGDPRLRLPRDPDYWVTVGGFQIGRYPVTVYEYARFVEDGGAEPDHWDDQLQRPNCPVVYVSWDDAQAYCEWAGVRLPAEAEWERAARGEERREYPWGQEPPDSERANYGGNLGRVSPVGLFPRGSTPEGIADMAGNVWEWVEDWYDDKQEYRVLRGGSWYVDAAALRAAYRSRDRPGFRYVNFGFRCVREVFS